MKKSILIIDDDQKLAQLLSKYLSENGYDVRMVGNAIGGIDLIRRSPPDLVTLDLMLPEMDGLTACREIRKFSKVPIVMLTARGDTTDRIVGLELGADDYLAKPFEPRELLARIQSVLRRSQDTGSDQLLVRGDLIIDEQRQEVSIAGKVVEISTAEFVVLNLLARHPRRVFTRDQIAEQLHGTNWTSFDRSIDVLVSRLRTRINDDPKTPKYIKTIRGSGYKFVGEVG